MQTDIYYRDVVKTENLEAFLLEKVEGAVQGFFKDGQSARLTVRVDTGRNRTANRKPSYVCEVVLKPMRAQKSIVVSKADEDFHTAVFKTVAALKKLLRKRSSIKAQHRRRDPMIGFIPPEIPLESTRRAA